MSCGLDNIGAKVIKFKSSCDVIQFNHVDHEIYTMGTSFCKTRYDAVTVRCQSPMSVNHDECLQCVFVMCARAAVTARSTFENNRSASAVETGSVAKMRSSSSVW